MAMDDSLRCRFNSKPRIDFLQCLDTDVSIRIMSFLDDPADVIRVGAVSRFWCQFVIANGIAKKMCLKVFPELSKIVGVVTDDWLGTMKSKNFEQDHTVYASLLQKAKRSIVRHNELESIAISASSTDSFPAKSVANTVWTKGTFISTGHSYWSSKGQSSPEVPETLLYKLKDNIYVITDIDIKPFPDYFQHGAPIYSAKSVRFRMGHPKSRKEMAYELVNVPVEKRFDDKFVWTYTSLEFPMKQENAVQRFKLPKEALCLGGFLQIELLGRVQRPEKDGLFYMCMKDVRVLGRSLAPTFGMEIKEASGEILLKYNPFPFPINRYSFNKMEHEDLLRMMHLPEELAESIFAFLEDEDNDDDDWWPAI